ncbi:lysophospholipid acyltransferase family protein [Pseudoroseomonas cervicalis]|uniref:lysophospholipid acyltransferase family protein n=1 Tax=Teichococcus cervicalis TaxID=204525 RepID=UPI0022F1B24F|nr:lysophospholipid acyltransferase family protein [Pseudoroseomonas cervicalis]WBV44798.1 lysophospholipid acyltransferase family protein [Pseudoroseomonas cervicalis]
MDWQLRPARDAGLTPLQRLRSQGREAGLTGALLQGLWRRASRLWLRCAHRLEIAGREHLPAEGPFLLIGNHSSHLDALSLAAALPTPLARRCYALAAGDVFFASARAATFAAYAVNALPVWRRRTRAGEIDLLRQRLTEDRLVFILFPEGTRSRDGAMAPFQPGIGALVAGTPIPVLPCYLEGAHAAWPATRALPRPGKLRLTIGAPLRFDAVAEGKEGWRQVARDCEAAVRRLGGLPPAS